MSLYLCDNMLKLIKLNNKYKKQFIELMEEWNNTNEKIIPYILNKIDYHYFDIFLKQAELIEYERVKVKSELYFLLDTKQNKLLGATVIRLQLNNDLLQRGGHISNGIRPSERNKGYGTMLVKLSIKKCIEIGINKILMVCEKNNIASAKTIIKNNGILENEITINNKIIQRYWIQGEKQ